MVVTENGCENLAPKWTGTPEGPAVVSREAIHPRPTERIMRCWTTVAGGRMASVTFDNQTIVNVGLHFACYQLSRRRWNVMPTARNPRGMEVLLYSQDASWKLSVQVKALCRSSPVPTSLSAQNRFAWSCGLNGPRIMEVQRWPRPSAASRCLSSF